MTNGLSHPAPSPIGSGPLAARPNGLTSQLDGARAKIAAAFGTSPEAGIAIASEGGFGPHSHLPFIPLARDLVAIKDRVSGTSAATATCDHRLSQGESVDRAQSLS